MARILSVFTCALLGFQLSLSAASPTSSKVLMRETNGERLARGLPPLPPVRRSTPTRRDIPGPSSVPGETVTGTFYATQVGGSNSNNRRRQDTSVGSANGIGYIRGTTLVASQDEATPMQVVVPNVAGDYTAVKVWDNLEYYWTGYSRPGQNLGPGSGTIISSISATTRQSTYACNTQEYCLFSDMFSIDPTTGKVTIRYWNPAVNAYNEVFPVTFGSYGDNILFTGDPGIFLAGNPGAIQIEIYMQ
ncbi:hypothetical protein DL96DRAFT_1713438 [Flagelloscypha sp. PMI_526]|nr:hypothetical protein DL96DRAFT_1713438 [Flagelloscypha sp. PMI_526]